MNVLHESAVPIGTVRITLDFLEWDWAVDVAEVFRREADETTRRRVVEQIAAAAGVALLDLVSACVVSESYTAACEELVRRTKRARNDLLAVGFLGAIARGIVGIGHDAIAVVTQQAIVTVVLIFLVKAVVVLATSIAVAPGCTHFAQPLE